MTNFRGRLAGSVEEGINSFRVSPQIHYPNIALSSSLIIMGILTNPEALIVGSILSTINTLLTIATIRTNYRNYKRIHENLVAHGWDERIIKPMTYTLCSRNAARVAAIDVGFRDEITEYYQRNRLVTLCT